ncbi:MAG: hypothetical protein Q4C10_06875 [Clostridia bacterium]|nr:hypothetical protein [Clostridia bacterium]
MAKRQKKNGKLSRGRILALKAFAALLLALVLLAGVAFLNASMVRVRRATVVVPDLPPAFENVSILYASDIDLCGVNTPTRAGRLFEQLQELKPDMLILGGDYTSKSLLEILNTSPAGSDDSESQTDLRQSFFHYIYSFDAPLGKYAVAAPEDENWDLLRQQLTEAGVQPLFNNRTLITSGDDRIWLAGVCGGDTNYNSAGQSFTRGDCVVVISYSPELLPVLLTSEASNSGRWCDLILTGHTHGGQIRLFGRSILPLTRVEDQYLSGWRTDSGLPILTTEGVGCEGVNLRLGSAPEVWMLTLRSSND